jgi:hypothetical protein
MGVLRSVFAKHVGRGHVWSSEGGVTTPKAIPSHFPQNVF